MNNKTPRKLTSHEFHLIKWNLQKSRAIMEHKLDEQKESLNASPDSLKEYYASRIKHYKEDIYELTILISALTDNSRALYELDAQ